MNEELMLAPREPLIGGWWDRLVGETRDGYGLFGPSSYILYLGGTRLLIDPCVRTNAVGEALASRIRRDLSNFDGIFISHEHEDHYDPHFFRYAAGLGARWHIPDFFTDASIKKSGLAGETIVPTSPDTHLRFGDVSVSFFESNHKNEGKAAFLREYGMVIEYAGKRLVFPFDVRTYDVMKMPVFDRVDLLFAHVWLGRGRALEEMPEPKLTEYCKFIRHFQPKRLSLAHLYETGRTPDEMWTLRHTDMIRERLCGIETVVPEFGTWITL